MKTVIAKAYLCFDALLEMIISLADSPARFTQTDLAEILGITLPTGTPTTINNVQYSDSLMDCGTNISIREINDFFHDNSNLSNKYVANIRLSSVPCLFNSM